MKTFIKCSIDYVPSMEVVVENPDRYSQRRHTVVTVPKQRVNERINISAIVSYRLGKGRCIADNVVFPEIVFSLMTGKDVITWTYPPNKEGEEMINTDMEMLDSLCYHQPLTNLGGPTLL